MEGGAFARSPVPLIITRLPSNTQHGCTAGRFDDGVAEPVPGGDGRQGGERSGDGSREARGGPPAVRAADPAEHGASDAALVRVHDLAGRPRGTGFLADHHGTVLTSHEAVDGLTRLVLSTAGAAAASWPQPTSSRCPPSAWPSCAPRASAPHRCR